MIGSLFAIAPALHSRRTKRILWLVWLLGLTLVVLLAATRNLDNYPLVSGDEVWVMSVSHKLAAQGVFGSDLFAGFSGAEQHYFLNPPLHHVWQAALFKVLGTGVAQARWVSLLAGMSLLWIVGWLAYRWFDLPTSLLCTLLLVFWRSDLIGLSPGLPTLAVARSGRYDVGAVAWFWLSLACLYGLLRRPGRLVALSLGACCAAATLTHFYGAFVIPVVAVAWLWHRGRNALRDPLSYWILLGSGLVLGPYVVYVAGHRSAYRGQMLLHQGRASLTTPTFYLQNLLHEPRRLAHIWQLPALKRPGYRPMGPCLFWLGLVPALVYLLFRARMRENVGARLLILSLVLPWGLLAIVEQVKAPLYTVALVPGLCMALAAASVGLVRWALGASRKHWTRLALASLVLGLLGLIVLEGAGTLWQERQRGDQVRNYLDVGQEIDARLAAGATVAGLERWWWALRQHPYRSLDNLWLQWWAVERTAAARPEFAGVVTHNSVEYILVNPQVAVYIRRYPQVLQDQFWAFLEDSCVLEASWEDESYRSIKVYRVQ